MDRREFLKQGAGKVPEPAKVPPFQAPWSYGNVPPELS